MKKKDLKTGKRATELKRGKPVRVQRVVRRQPRIPKRFLEIVHDITRTYAIRKMCKELGFPLAPDDAAFKKEQRAKWAEARSYMRQCDHHKLLKLVQKYSREHYDA